MVIDPPAVVLAHQGQDVYHFCLYAFSSLQLFVERVGNSSALCSHGF